jgi:hypothetical protein
MLKYTRNIDDGISNRGKGLKEIQRAYVKEINYFAHQL